MSFALLDDRLTEHPKWLITSSAAHDMFIAAICYCARLLTDGFVPMAQIRKLIEHDAPLQVAEELAEAHPPGYTSGLFDRHPNGYLVHDYLDWNPSRDVVLAKRERRADAGRQGGKNSVATRRERYGTAQPEGRSEANPEANASTYASNTPPKQTPNPTPTPIPTTTPNGVVGARGTRLPNNWELPDGWRESAKSERPTLDIDLEARKFRDYWTAKPGREALKLDWERTWMNWIRNARSTSGTASAGPPTSTQPAQPLKLREDPQVAELRRLEAQFQAKRKL